MFAHTTTVWHGYNEDCINSGGSPIVVVAPLSTISSTVSGFGELSATSHKSSLRSESEVDISKGSSEGWSTSAEFISTSSLESRS